MNFLNRPHLFLIQTLNLSFVLSCYRSIVLSCYRSIVLSCYRAIVLSCHRAIVPSCLRAFVLFEAYSYLGNFFLIVHTGKQFFLYGSKSSNSFLNVVKGMSRSRD